MKNLFYSTVLFSVLLFGCQSDEDSQPLEFPEEIRGTISYQNFERLYALHIPNSYNGTKEVPLVIVLHGGSGNLESVQGFTLMNPVSDQNGFIIAYPQGYGVASNGFSWADGRNTSADALGVDDVGFIDKLIDKIESNFKIQSSKIYLCGFSNGSFMTQRIACELNGRFAAMASLGSTMGRDQFSACDPTRVIPMMFIMGDADPFVPYNGGIMSSNPTPIVGIETLVGFWKDNNGCQTSLAVVDLPNTDTSDNSTVTVTEYTDCSCNADVKLYRVNGGGHTWPGVESVSYETIAGETNEDMNASVEMWQFFNQFELCQ